MIESLSRGFKEGINPDNLILEVNSSRHAYAVTASQVVTSVTVAILTIAQGALEGTEPSPAKLLLEIKKAMKLFKVTMNDNVPTFVIFWFLYISHNVI